MWIDAARTVLRPLLSWLFGATWLRRLGFWALSPFPSLREQIYTRLFGRMHAEANARKIAASLQPRSARKPALWVDVSGLVAIDRRTGIQRAVRGLCLGLQAIQQQREVVPVFATPDRLGYWIASELRDHPLTQAHPYAQSDGSVLVEPGDIFLGLDFQAGGVIRQRAFLEAIQQHGVSLQFVVYDLLPIRYPQWFSDWAHIGHTDWLRQIARADHLHCISHAVRHDLSQWGREQRPPLDLGSRSSAFHLGADLHSTRPTQGLPENAPALLQQLAHSTSFLMVGTIEPRKGHAQVLDAFDILWAQQQPIQLVIAGKPGWKVDSLLQRLQSHPRLGHQLHYLGQASDEYLESLYTACSGLIAASYDEGFGLPLIEAAQRGLPILARDIAVFREVAGEHAYFWSAQSGEQLSHALRHWVALYSQGAAPRSTSLPWLTWAQSAEQLWCNITQDRS